MTPSARNAVPLSGAVWKPARKTVRQRVGLRREPVLLDRLVARSKVDDDVAFAQRFCPRLGAVRRRDRRGAPSASAHPNPILFRALMFELPSVESSRVCLSRSAIAASEKSRPKKAAESAPTFRRHSSGVAGRAQHWTRRSPSLNTKVMPARLLGRGASPNSLRSRKFFGAVARARRAGPRARVRHNGSTARSRGCKPVHRSITSREHPRTACARRTVADTRARSSRRIRFDRTAAAQAARRRSRRARSARYKSERNTLAAARSARSLGAS